MESYLPLGGFQLPFQRRLSRLYNDTKKSSDFVKEPVQNAEDPEIKMLHRKLRIQKDRLVSWGLEWSDPNQSAEIDESLSKAGLSEVVGSIMSTIKDILAEAEPLWQSSKRLVGGEKQPEKSVGDKKIPLVVWDKGRFEDLVRDLTTSIDTLYDLSRTRSSAALSSQARARLFKSGGSTEDLRAFESTRMQTPQQIDPQSLTSLRQMQAVPMSETADTGSREIVFMSKQAFSELTHHAGRQPYSPLLLEYAEFDPMYSATGIMPSMSRFEKLSSGLQTEPQRSPGSWTGLPRLLGYFEDMEHSRLGLVYQFPPTFNPVSFEHLTQNPLYNLCSLSDLLARPDFEPTLEAKFRLAFNLANTVFDMHARGVSHGNLFDANVSFCNAVGTEPGMGNGEVDIRRPLISSFDLFPDSFQETGGATFSLYRHPLDPKVTAQASALITNPDSKTYDLYSLAMLLLSIGLWTNLDNLVPTSSPTSIPESVLEQLAIRCGTLYMKAVQACWNAVDQELSGQLSGEQVLARVQVKASRYLEACCILDSVGGLEERLSDDLGDDTTPAKRTQSTASAVAGSSKEKKEQTENTQTEVASTPATLPAPSLMSADVEKRNIVESPTPVFRTEDSPVEMQPKQPSSKLRLYPHIPLPPDAVEQWNMVVMPQINQALRHFYRKHPESVEISLESIGESPKETQPTVLVVCTSVSKVRAILKRKLGLLFDGTTGFALKVCRGQVLRSRNRGPARSMAKPDEDGDTGAANGDFQERPHNGASIGAWIGDRHLPPVSFGGLVLVDDKPYGMTVHHMLDDPDQPQSATTPGADSQILRSGARSNPVPDLAAWYAEQYADQDSSGDSSGTEDFACEFSDSDSDAFSESAITSEDESQDSDAESDSGVHKYDEAGDIPGVEPGCGDGYIITQPALDDVTEGFYPSPETQDEDHLDTFSLGEMYASSGIRRRSDDSGLIHEVDWALFEFKTDRLPDQNSIPQVMTGRRQRDRNTHGRVSSAIHPTAVAPTSSLPGLEVQCMARTSGLQTGLILPTITSVKIYGRMTPSHTYQVTGRPNAKGSASTEERREKMDVRSAPLPMGIPGDSGAWVVDCQHEQVCGHVLAWSERKRVAYICPMEVLLLDIAETLEASEVRLPGGEAVVSSLDQDEGHHNLSHGDTERQGATATGYQGSYSDLDTAESTGRRHGLTDEGFHEDDDLEIHPHARRTRSKKIPSKAAIPGKGLLDVSDNIDALSEELDSMHVRRSDVGVKASC